MKKNAAADLDMCIRLISKHDTDALETLYKELSDPVFRFATMLLKDTHLAQDAMQETFLRIMANADKYRAHTNARAWIFSIARNICYDIANNARKFPSTDDDILSAVSAPDEIAERTLMLDVSRALDKLTDTEREIVSLYAVSGLKQTEIAKMLELSYGEVRAHYGYAIKKLRKELL